MRIATHADGISGRMPRAYISLRSAGCMSLSDKNAALRRNEWLQSLGFDPASCAVPGMHHSKTVLDATARLIKGVAGDGLITKPGSRTAALVITVADCMPILLYDDESGAFGLLHSGWQGTGIMREAAKCMARVCGTRYARLHAVFGPHIAACCYTVDDDRAKRFAAEFGEAAVKRIDGTARIDLRAANESIAADLGFASVRGSELCTCCDARFGSFRREGTDSFTKMAVVFGLPRHAKDQNDYACI